MKNEILTLWSKLSVGNWQILTGRELKLLLGLLATIIALAIYLVVRFIEPPPPKTITISAGSPTGAYYQYAQSYAKALKKHGITLIVLESKGSVENLLRLKDPKSKVDLAFVQTGVVDSDSAPELESLASVSYEPLWVLSKPSKKFERLIDIKGKRIAIGPDGSGTQPVALEFLKSNGIDSTNSNFSNVATTDAYAALKSDQIDVMMVIASPSAASIKTALADGMQVMEFDHADAYVRRYPWMSKVILPKGATDFAKNAPNKDIQLVAANANLVARADTHRAIAFLVLDVASEVHSAPGPLHDLRQFPNEKSLQFTQSEESKRFFKTGRPFLQKYLPFWLANLFERLLVSIVPIFAIGIPLAKLLSAMLEYREKSQLLQLYEATFTMESKLGRTLSTEQSLAELSLIEKQMQTLRLGAGKHVELYNLKGHLDAVRAKLSTQLANKP